VSEKVDEVHLVGVKREGNGGNYSTLGRAAGLRLRVLDGFSVASRWREGGRGRSKKEWCEELQPQQKEKNKGDSN